MLALVFIMLIIINNEKKNNNNNNKMVNKVAELSIEHILLFVIASYLLYHFVGNCRCNSFSVGGQNTGIDCSKRTLLKGCVSGSDCRELCNNPAYTKEECNDLKFYGNTVLGINEYGCQYNDNDGCLGDTNYDSLCNNINRNCNGSAITSDFKTNITIKNGEVLKITKVIPNTNKINITINPGGTLCIYISLNIYGTLINEGTIINNKDKVPHKSLNIYGTLINEGTIINKGTIVNDGILINKSLIVNNGGMFNYSNSFEVNNGTIENNSVIWNGGQNTLKGQINLKNNTVINGFGVIINGDGVINNDNGCICIDQTSEINCRILNPIDCRNCSYSTL